MHGSRLATLAVAAALTLAGVACADSATEEPMDEEMEEMEESMDEEMEEMEESMDEEMEEPMDEHPM